MSRVLVVAPHPDDETLGCGGTLLRHRAVGDEVHWLIVTAMRPEDGFPEEKIAARREEIERVAGHYGFAGRHELGLPAARLDRLPLAELVQAIGAVVQEVRPERVYLPYAGDAHSDHRVVFEAASAALKWFRAPDVARIFAYETLSETGFNLDPTMPEFRPNWFVDIAGHLEGKCAAMAFYAGESGRFPFPRSEEAITALARLRGSHCGCDAAEAFLLLKGIEG